MESIDNLFTAHENDLLAKDNAKLSSGEWDATMASIKCKGEAEHIRMEQNGAVQTEPDEEEEDE